MNAPTGRTRKRTAIHQITCDGCSEPARCTARLDCGRRWRTVESDSWSSAHSTRYTAHSGEIQIPASSCTLRTHDTLPALHTAPGQHHSLILQTASTTLHTNTHSLSSTAHITTALYSLHTLSLQPTLTPHLISSQHASFHHRHEVLVLHLLRQAQVRLSQHQRQGDHHRVRLG